MPSFSISIFRHHTSACLRSPILRHVSPFRSLSISAARHRNPNHPTRKLQEPSKHLLKARESVKQFSTTLSPSLSADPNDVASLSPNHAVGMVASAQANFMRVVVQSTADERIGVELLCVVRSLLKKIKRRVLVGDKVLVGAIDWIDRRGMIENVFERKSEVTDPPVANVDHFLVLFSMDQPKLEPFSLTRFLVEAESSGIPVTVALNKTELVDEEV